MAAAFNHIIAEGVFAASRLSYRALRKPACRAVWEARPCKRTGILQKESREIQLSRCRLASHEADTSTADPCVRSMPPDPYRPGDGLRSGREVGTVSP